MASPILKLIAAFLLYGAWLILVLTGKAPADPFIQFVELAIIALGIVQYNGAIKP